MPTDLRYDLDYLKSLVTEAIRVCEARSEKELNMFIKPRSAQEVNVLADILDYFMYLCLDATDDPCLTQQLIERFSALQTWLQTKRADKMKIFLFTLKQLLTLQHDKISRKSFMDTWKSTASKLGL
jgi:hypothetical protein